MIIFHTADNHLNSSLKTRLNEKQAEKINAELIFAFEEICTIASEKKAEALIIAGDLFDGKNVTGSVLQRVKRKVENHPELLFLYVYGNHDYDQKNDIFELFPENFKVMSPDTSIKRGNVVFYAYGQNLPTLDRDAFNIVIGHGQTVKSESFNSDEINLSFLKNKNIDYAALGHIHKFSLEQLDERCYYAYSGCPMGRGFDEVGRKGCVEINTDEKTFTFVPLNTRQFYIESVNVENFPSSFELEKALKEKLNFDESSFVRLVLNGLVSSEEQGDFSYITEYFKEKFFYFELVDQTAFNYETLITEDRTSLKNEFIKVVQASNEPFAKEIIETGLKYLK